MFNELKAIPATDEAQKMIDIMTSLAAICDAYQAFAKNPTLEIAKIINQLRYSHKDITIDVGMQIFKYGRGEFVPVFLKEMAKLKNSLEKVKKEVKINDVFEKCVNDALKDVDYLIDLFNQKKEPKNVEQVNTPVETPKEQKKKK